MRQTFQKRLGSMEIKPPEKAPKKKVGINVDIAEIYSSSQWKRLRQSYKMQHPLCEMCLVNDIITPCSEVHHIRPISTGKNLSEMWTLALDSNNLMSLCECCHKQIHNELRNKKSSQQKSDK